MVGFETDTWSFLLFEGLVKNLSFLFSKFVDPKLQNSFQVNAVIFMTFDDINRLQTNYID